MRHWRLWVILRANVDSAIVIALAIVVAAGGLMDKLGAAVTTNATLAALGLIALAILRIHATMQKTQTELERIDRKVGSSLDAKADDLFSSETPEALILRQ